MHQNIMSDDFRKMRPSPGAAPEIKFKEEQLAVLPNGLKIILVHNDKLPRISAQLFIDHGLQMQKDKAGFIEITGQLLSCGTENHHKAEWDSRVDYLGALIAPSSIGGIVSSLTKHFDSAMSLFSEAILQPSFPQNEFDNIIKQHLSNLVAQKDEAESIASTVARKVTYNVDHPYYEVMSEESIKNITVNDCREYHRKNFVPEISYLMFEGDIKMEEALILSDKYFGAWKNNAFQKIHFDNSFPENQFDVNFIEKRGAVQSFISFVYAINYQPYNDEMIAANLMNSVLGGYFSSRLNLNLREKRGYTYGISSRLHTDEHIGSFHCSVNVRNEVTGDAINEILSEMQRLIDAPLREDELQQVKNVVSGNFSRSVEDSKTIVKYALAKNKFNLPVDYFRSQLQKISAVTSADIQKMAKKYLQPDNLHIIVVGHSEVLPQLSKISNDDGVRVLNFEGNFINYFKS